VIFEFKIPYFLTHAYLQKRLKMNPTFSASRIITSFWLALCSMLLALETGNASIPAPTTAYQQLSFRTLRLYLPGKKPPQEVMEMNGKSVEVMGFMAALTQLEEIDEFVLASSPPMNCFCHPPLRVNEVVFVQMKKGKKTEYKGGVVRVRGKLIVNTTVTDEFADIMYTIECEEVL
jgi:hypothetical protein